MINIFKHDEFQRRMTKEFLHHDEITTGEHILKDTIVTYILSRKLRKKDNYDLEVALKTAMMHDLYTLPWQNNPKNKVNNFYNKHGFRHPIEAVLNSYKWFKEEFTDKENTEKIVDGIVHHMYPLPVRRFNLSDTNDLELRNYEIIETLDEDLKQILIDSSNRNGIGPVSLSLSKNKEGRIVNVSDKISSMYDLSTLNGYIALVTGNNKNINKKK